MPGRSTYIPSPLGGGLGRGFGGIPSYNPYPTLSLRRERVFWRPHFFALLFFTICPIMRGNIHIPLIRMAKSHFSQLTVALIAVVVSSVVAAAGLTIAQTGSESWSCDMNAGGEKGQGPTTCGGQGRPDWPDCILFTCTATGGSGGGCSGMDTSTLAYRCCINPGSSECAGGGGGSCSGTPPTSTSWCDNGAWREPSSTTGCPGSQPGAGYWCSGSTWMPPSGGGGWQATPEVQAACRDRCNATGKYSQSNCQIYCEDGDFEGAGGGSTGDMSATCTACITAGGTQMSCLTCPGYTGGGGWSTGQMRRCFYPNASINGVKASFTVWCEGDYVNCHEGEPSGRSVPNAGLSLGAPSTCDSGTGGNGGGATSYAECVAKECASMLAPTAYQACKDSCQSRFGGGGGGGGTGNATCVADCVATTQGMCSAGGLSDGKRGVCDFKAKNGWAGDTCERMCNGGSGGGDGAGMDCREEAAYWTCIGGRGSSTRSDSALAKSCADKHCGYEGGGDGESCRRECEQNLRGCQQPRASVAYSPMWCNETLEQCLARCPGGRKGEPEGCRGTPPISETPGTWECVGKEWKFKKLDRKPPEDDLGVFCAKFPTSEKCRKPEPRPVPVTGTLEEKLAALEEIIAGLDDQVAGLRNDLADAKDAVSEKKDEIRTLKKSKAPRAEISAAQKELKKMKRTASAIVRNGKKLTRELKFREKEYDRLSLQVPPPYRVY